MDGRAATAVPLLPTPSPCCSSLLSSGKRARMQLAPAGSRILAMVRAMRSAVPCAMGIATGALAVHERRARREAERLAAATLETLLNAIEANDAQTGMHVRRVAAYALVIADALELSEHECR